jgi:protein gp37
MGEKTKISWCDHTFNPWWGCSKVSAGCENCYAETWAKRIGFDIFGNNKPRRFFGTKHWDEPLKWNATAAAAGERRRVFCGSMCDVFEADGIVPSGADECDYVRDALWNLIEATPQLDWLLLSKRPQHIEAMVPSEWYYPEHVRKKCRYLSERIGQEVVPDRPLGWPANVWLLATVENQQTAVPRIGPLLQVPAAILGLSMEPLLGPVDIRPFLGAVHCNAIEAPQLPSGYAWPLDKQPWYSGVNWIIIGCEKLPGERAGRRCELDWVRSLVCQARAAGVAVFVKQLEIAGRVSADPNDWPEDLRIQEFPQVQIPNP